MELSGSRTFLFEKRGWVCFGYQKRKRGRNDKGVGYPEMVGDRGLGHPSLKNLKEVNSSNSC